MTGPLLDPPTAGAPTERSPRLDVLRGLAACLVLAAHASRLSTPASQRAIWSPGVALLGQSGVVLFFVLSGYLVGGMWVRPDRMTPSLSSYATRRLLRIWPAYAVAYVATVLLTHPVDVRAGWQWPLHLLLLHSWVPGQYVAVFPVGWTLGVEAMFYLAAPWLPRSARGVGRLWCLSALVAVLAGLIAPASSDPAGWVGPLRYSLPALIGLFCPGILIAIRPGWLDRLRDQPALAGFVGLVALALAFWVNLAQAVWLRDLRYQALAVAFGILLLLVVDRSVQPAHSLRPFAALGVISYGVYLWHDTLMTLLLKAGVRAPDGSWAVAVLILAAVSIPVGWLSWTVVERPALRYATRLTGRRHQQPRLGPVRLATVLSTKGDYR